MTQSGDKISGAAKRDAKAVPLFSLGLNQSIGKSADLIERLEAAEAAGFDLFSIMDHPYAADRHEAYATLGFALGRTRRIAGYVGVTNLPLRPPAVLARTLTTLSSLSGGRVVLGLGSGGMWEQITTMGVPRLSPRQAVNAFEEAIRLVHALSDGPGQPVDFDGDHYRVHGLKPATVPAPLIWTGAGGPRTLAITGRLADGWIPQAGADWRSATYRDGRPVVDQAAIDAGRAPSGIRTVFNVVAALTDRDLAWQRGEDGRWRGGSTAQWIDELTTAVRDHGAGGFNVNIADESGAFTTQVAERFAAEVIPAVREAVR